MAKTAKASKTGGAAGQKKSNQEPIVPDWESYFDPRKKKRIELDVHVQIASVGLPFNFFKSIWVTHLIVKEVLKGVDGVNHKTANAAAISEWRGKLQAAVYANLDNGGNWEGEGTNVLVVAKDMGLIAGVLSGTKPEAGTNQLKSAFAATKSHTTCSAGGGVGGGAWCSFDWF